MSFVQKKQSFVSVYVRQQSDLPTSNCLKVQVLILRWTELRNEQFPLAICSCRFVLPSCKQLQRSERLFCCTERGRPLRGNLSAYQFSLHFIFILTIKKVTNPKKTSQFWGPPGRYERMNKRRSCMAADVNDLNCKKRRSSNSSKNRRHRLTNGVHGKTGYS